MNDVRNRTLLSELRPDGSVRLTVQEQPIAQLAGGEILVRIEAAPINPSDIGMMLASADPKSARVVGSGPDRALVADLMASPTAVNSRRIGRPLQIGNEGAGVVVDAAPDCASFIGKRVALLGGAMFAEYRCVTAADVLVLPDEVSTEDGAALFVNPLTALAMVETARREEHHGIVHTAAASSLGRMLNRICRDDRVPLINLVRSEAHRSELMRDGAEYALNTSADGFYDDLISALIQTRGSIAFDAIGGGSLGSTILEAMEVAAAQTSNSFNNYGSTLFKQLYIYGSLDPSPTVLNRRYGLSWAVGGFLMTPALQWLSSDSVAGMKARILAEAKTTFATHYAARIGLDDLLEPDTIARIARRATAEKYLLTPSVG